MSNLIIAGAGLAGLSLALECARRPYFNATNLVLLDRDDKTRNDRTWCFWAQDGEPLPPVLYKSWNECRFFGEKAEVAMKIAPYRYHMIRGLDFYNWAKTELAKYPNVRLVKADIQDMDAVAGIVSTDQGDFQGTWVFNSAQYRAGERRYTVDGARWLKEEQPRGDQLKNTTFLLQHFKGWMIETQHSAFDPNAVTFMDYRLEQSGETRFVYVLPFSATKALVEFTIFSPALCRPEVYDAELNRYLSEVLQLQDYQVLEEEFGVIPMTDLPLSPRAEGRLVHIGTAGGFVKASSGYAFLRTQRKIRRFVDAWEQNGRPDPDLLRSAPAYRALDAIMLHVLRTGAVSGRDFFTRLFQKLPAPLVFRFLDEDATLPEVLRVLSAPPTWPFLKAAWAGIRGLR
jgi:lycopene beta-cyclase